MSMPSFQRIPSYPLPTSTPFTRQTAFSFIERLEDLYVIVREAYDLISTRDEAYKKLISDANTAITSALEIIKNAQDDVEANAAEVRATLAALVDALDRLTVAESSLNTASNNFNTKVAEFQGMVTAFGKRLDALEIKSATHVAKDHLFIDVTDHGAKGNGVTDDYAAITAAAQAAGEYGTVFFPKGVYVVDHTLTKLEGQNWFGYGFQGASRNQEGETAVIHFTGQVGAIIDNGVGGSIEGLVLQGPGPNMSGTVGVVARGAVHLEGVMISHCETAVSFNQVWYGIIKDCYFSLNTYAGSFKYCYNLNLYNLRVNCGKPDGDVGQGFTFSDRTMVTIHGCAIEGFGNYGIKATNHVTIATFGLYMESEKASKDIAVCWNLREWTGFGSILTCGGQYYVTNFRSIFDFSVGSTGQFMSQGNRFKGGSSDANLHIYRWPEPGDGLNVDISGDATLDVVKGDNVRYISSLDPFPKLSRVRVPYGSPGREPAREYTSLHRQTLYGDSVMTVTSTTRPPASTMTPGTVAFNTTTNKLEIWNGTRWVWSDGDAVS